MMDQHTLSAVLLGVIILLSGMGLAYTQHTNRQLFIELQRQQAQRDKLEIEWELLRLEQSTLVTDSAVEGVARAKLDMQPPDPNTVLYVTP